MILLTLLRRRRTPRGSVSRFWRDWPGRPRRRTALYLVPLLLTGCRSTMSEHQTPPPPASMTPGTAAVPTSAGAAAAVSGQSASMASAHHSRKKAKSRSKPSQELAQEGPAFSSKLTPDQRYNAHLELGRFQESQENFDLALEEYQKALEVCGQHPALRNGAVNARKQAIAHRRMGSALDRLGRFEEAENEYKTALKKSPNDPKIWNDAGYSYYLQGRWTDAERALKTACSLEPGNTRALTNLGLTLAAAGKTDAALAALTKAGGQAVGHANLAYILASMNNIPEARQHYQIALGLQPQLGAAREALAALDAKAAQLAQVSSGSVPPAPGSLVINRPGALPAYAPQPDPNMVALAAPPLVPGGQAFSAVPAQANAAPASPAPVVPTVRTVTTGSMDPAINRTAAAVVKPIVPATPTLGLPAPVMPKAAVRPSSTLPANWPASTIPPPVVRGGPAPAVMTPAASAP